MLNVLRLALGGSFHIRGVTRVAENVN
jgi:hypothetical protein